MKQQSVIEEIFNSITHGIGFTFGLVGLVLLVDMAIRTGDRARIVGFSIYGVTLILLYLMSTLYHGARSARAKHILRICDHASIYLLIAGSYTPFCLVVLPSFWGTLMMAILWPLAVLGEFAVPHQTLYILVVLFRHHRLFLFFLVCWIFLFQNTYACLLNLS